MKLQFSISPDYNADQLAQWFFFNTWLQRTLGREVHLEPYGDFGSLRTALAAGAVDLVFANSFDTAFLVRKRGFLPVARPRGRADEAVVVVAAASPLRGVLDLPATLRVAATEAPDVEMIGAMLIEPAGVARDRLQILPKANHVLVAKELLSGGVDAAFFLERSFLELSELVRGSMRALVASRIYVLRHALLLSPRLADLRAPLLAALGAMGGEPRGRRLLDDLGFGEGWEEATLDDAEFMIDLMNTLVD